MANGAKALYPVDHSENFCVYKGGEEIGCFDAVDSIRAMLGIIHSNISEWEWDSLKIKDYNWEETLLHATMDEVRNGGVIIYSMFEIPDVLSAAMELVESRTIDVKCCENQTQTIPQKPHSLPQP